MDVDQVEDQNPLAHIEHMLLPKDRLVKLIFPVYKPSLYCQLLSSEIKRNLFSDAIIEKSLKTDVLRLSELCNIVIGKSFKSGKMDPRLNHENKDYIAEYLDSNMPIEDVVELENETFWQRVFSEQCMDGKLKCLKLHNEDTNFKNEALQVKLANIIETTSYELWDDERMNELARLVSPFIYNLHISKMIPMKETNIDCDPNLAGYKIHNYSDKDCHHGNLEMIGFLENLTKLELELLPPLLQYDFNRRNFLFSYLDIENLANGFKRLRSLNHLSIKRSRLDDRKMKILVRGLLHLPLQFVEFSYCELGQKSGLCIAKLLQNASTIKTLELEGNYLGKDGLEPIAYALRDYKGKLEYYGLARNPITNDGVYMVGSGLLGTEQVTHLNLNGVEVTPTGAKYIVELMDAHTKLTKMDMCCVPLGEKGGNALIELLRRNKYIHHLECRGCDMTQDQEFKIRLLVSRNEYFRQNPALRDEVTTREMEDAAEDWAARVKHPVLLKANDLLKKKTECYRNRAKPTVFEDTVPFFIHKKALVQKTNSELLGAHFAACSGADSELSVYQMELEKERYKRRRIYDPNLFDEKDIARHARIGQTDRPHFYYFKPSGKRQRKFV